ncbi:hypothetical protein A3C86_02350 [Candidatus Kaiserbacteria bacterium RIFCSPHIGHO2_02_FULL_49_16]|uniref:Uncharacterized protein n=1 Tax=Candidatus Kaiserbacteria bacterium RIFCSPHIGHO2_02_FULL_49_16 TaxID=1798490 RepID=A0A1F6D9L6_9BACT|nr:MAG: hypothetical protein A3C86_02350 [Candidatus Kaiserbacteria bacterium RIFCSPHIGHO2_02_FULL_49_16]
MPKSLENKRRYSEKKRSQKQGTKTERVRSKPKDDLLHATDIYQNLYVLSLMQFRKLERTSETVRLQEDKLRKEIAKWGGIGKIEQWLKDNDPYFARPSGFRDFDWSWLPENLRQ